MYPYWRAIYKRGLTVDVLWQSWKNYVNELDNAEDIEKIFQYYYRGGPGSGRLSLIICHPRSEQTEDPATDVDESITHANSITKRRCIPVPPPSTIDLVTRMIPEGSVLKALKKRCLQLYSRFGLTPLHLDCATERHYWSDKPLERYLKNGGDVNATISRESPLWPANSPLLIAAKLGNKDLVKFLLDLGADPSVRDSEGNTPLHYLWSQNENAYDERLFAYDGRDTFGSITGGTHFHMACKSRALDVVKRYLDQGVSPDLPMKECTPIDENLSGQSLDDAGKVGLHLARDIGFYTVCHELVQLLLEYGADVNKKDIKGRTPLNYFLRCFETSTWRYDFKEAVECACLLIDAGSVLEGLDTNDLEQELSQTTVEIKRLFLSNLKKLIVLNENLVWNDLYGRVAKNISNGWNEAEYVARCSKELDALTRLGLRPILDDTIVVNANFEDKFGFVVDSFDPEAYPIYGELLTLKVKRKLHQQARREKKKRKIWQAIPKVLRLFQEHGPLPHLCAEKILWNLNDEDLTLLINGL